MTLPTALAVLAAAGLLLSPGTAAQAAPAPPAVHEVRLDPQDESSTVAAVNRDGAIVGTTSRAADGGAVTWHPFLYAGGRLQLLTVPGTGADYVTARDVNDHEDVVVYRPPDGWLLHDGAWTDLGPGLPLQVDDARRVLLQRYGPDGLANELLLWDAGQVRSIWPRPGTDTTGFSGASLNDAGQVAFSGYTPDGATLGYVWSRGRYTELPPLAAGGRATVTAINDRGDVAGAGSLTPGGPDLPVIWHRGAVRALPTLTTGDTATGSVLDLNERGQAVGTSEDAAGYSHAMLWTRGRAVPLDGPGPLQSHDSASLIDDAGQVVGVQVRPASVFTFVPTIVMWWRGSSMELGTGTPVGLSERGLVGGDQQPLIGRGMLPPPHATAWTAWTAHPG